MTVQKFISVEITEEKLNQCLEHKKTVTYPNGWDNDECPNCNGDKSKLKTLPGGSWTTVDYCQTCDCVLYRVEADRMSGNHSENVKVYKDKS